MNLVSKFAYDFNNYQQKNDINVVANAKFHEVNRHMWSEHFKKCSIYDYTCTIGCGDLVLLLGCGGDVIYELPLNSQLNCLDDLNNRGYHSAKEWRKLEAQFRFELPKETLLLAEKCKEYTNEVIRVILNFCFFLNKFFESE